MLIGIDANEANLTSHRVGINQYVLGLLQALSVSSSPHQFIIYLKTSPLADLPVARPGWTYRIIPFPKLWTQTRLPWDLYTHSPRPDVFLSLTHYAPRWSPVPTVVSVMDLGFLSSPDQFTPRDFNQLKHWTEYSVHQAAKVITISEFSRTAIINIYHRAASDVEVIYPSYDPNLFKPTVQPAILNKYSISKPYFLFLGSLRPSKNIEGLITAFADLRLKDYSLVIAGKKGWLYETIFKLVSDLHLADRVIFPGFVDEADVPGLMSQAAAFALPSFYEGFGIPVLEAMACGTPVVVSRVASLPEVAGDAGIYVDPYSPGSIATGLGAAIGPTRRRFVSAGLHRVKLFSWAVAAAKTLNLLESIHV